MQEKKKVFIIHGFNSSPNSSWYPWLMAELKKEGVYACSLPMPNPEAPLCSEWVGEISKWVNLSPENQIYLIGHSAGAAAVLNYLQCSGIELVSGIILVSGRYEKSNNPLTANFYGDFDFNKIIHQTRKIVVFHGDNDELVSFEKGKALAEKLGVKLVVIKNGGHLNGAAGFRTFPECIDILKQWFLTD
jgi:predicted alpha/beta hydrolase family esterase